jgi:HEAT repeat protein
MVVGGVLCGTVALLTRNPTDLHHLEVKQLVSRGSFAERLLVQIGPDAYPALARLVRGRDTKLDEEYEDFRSSLPPQLARLLPQHESRAELHQKVQPLIAEMGPGASRALVGAIHDSLTHRKMYGDEGLLQALYWSIPESPKAVATLHGWLSQPDQRRGLFGMRDAVEIWPSVPQLAPLLTSWLRLADPAHEAAIAFGTMGTNAAFAIPDLIDVFHHGVAGQPAGTYLIGQSTPGIDPLLRNRRAAIQALGDIGIASPAVLATLAQAWVDPHPDLRALSADAVGKLGCKALPILEQLIASLDTTNRIVLEYQVQAIGRLGPAAHGAIPVLRRWADPRGVAELATPEPLGLMIRWSDDPLPLPGGAAAALLLIAPDGVKGFGKVIAEALVPGPHLRGVCATVERLRELRPLAGEIMPALEPALKDQRQWVRQLTALQILCLGPEHEGAISALVAGFEQPGPASLRAQAAVYYWRMTGDTNRVLPVLLETVQPAKDSLTQGPLNYAAEFASGSEPLLPQFLEMLLTNGLPPLCYVAELGPAARPLVPKIQALLTNESWLIRQQAGKALRRIAPTALPPINER